MRETDCKTCLMEHDDEIHAATVSLHEWLRETINRRLQEPVPVEAAAAA